MAPLMHVLRESSFAPSEAEMLLSNILEAVRTEEALQCNVSQILDNHSTPDGVPISKVAIRDKGSLVGFIVLVFSVDWYYK